MTISFSRLKPLLLSLLIASLLTACSNSKPNSTTNSSSESPAASSSSSGEAFEGLITSKMSLTSQQMEIRYSIKGARSRVETQLAAGGVQTGVVLMDFAAGTQTMLVPQMKTYMTTNWNDEGGLKNLAEKAASNTFLKATPTGKTETIAGHSCTHWIIGDKQDMDTCLAKGLGYFGGGGGANDAFDKLRSIALGGCRRGPPAVRFARPRLHEHRAFRGRQRRRDCRGDLRYSRPSHAELGRPCPATG